MTADTAIPHPQDKRKEVGKKTFDTNKILWKFIIQGRRQPIKPVGPGLHIFGLITLPLLI